MLSLFLAFLRIRTLIILGILYSFLSIASHGNFSLKIPDLKTLNLSNISASINSMKDQVLGGNSKTKKDSDTAKTSGATNQLDDIKNSVTQLKKEVDEVMGNKK
jgi:hypothetical protein